MKKSNFLNSQTHRTIGNSQKTQNRSNTQNTENFHFNGTNTDKNSKQTLSNVSQITTHYIDGEIKKFQESLEQEQHALVMFEAERKVFANEGLE